jgi:putative transposase
VVLFAFILDAWSRRVVSWQLAGHMRTTLVLDALRMALHGRGPGVYAPVSNARRMCPYWGLEAHLMAKEHGRCGPSG